MKPSASPAADQQAFCEITDLTHDGRGVTRLQGKVCFVPGALVGEKVTLTNIRHKRNFIEAQLNVIEQVSPQRVEPRCEYFGRCGGCQLQHLDYAAQLEARQAHIKALLTKAGLPAQAWREPVASSPWHYRRRARLTARKDHNKHIVGFFESHSRQVCPVSHCEILEPALSAVIPELPTLLDQLDAGIDSIDIARHPAGLLMSLCGQMRAERIALLNSGDLPGWKVQYRDNKGQVRDLRSGEPAIWLAGFMQANDSVNEQLVQAAAEMLRPDSSDQLLDLFCGAGNFSFALASEAMKVTGMEGAADLVQAARDKSAELHCSERVQFEQVDLFDAQQLKARRKLIASHNLVLLDPPRAGAQEAVTLLSHTKPSRILYVSCHPSTFVRDAGLLTRCGYRISQIGMFDMFPQTMHAEMLALLEI